MMAITAPRRAALTYLAFSYANSALSMITGVFLVPLYLRHVGIATYGAWAACANAINILGVLELGFNLPFSERVARAVAKDDSEELGAVLGSGIAITCASAVGLIVSVALVTAPLIAALAPPSDADSSLFAGALLGALGCALGMIQAAFVAPLHAWRIAHLQGIATTLGLFCGLAATIGGLFVGLGVASIGAGMAARSAITVSSTGYALRREMRRREIRVRLTSSSTTDLLRMIRSIAIGRGALILASNTDALVTGLILGADTAAVVSITSRLFELARMVVNPIAQAVFPEVARRKALEGPRGAARSVRDVLSLAAFASALLIGPALASNPDFVHLWVGPSAFGGTAVSVAFGAYMLFWLRLNLLHVLVQALGQQGPIARVATVEIVGRIVLLVGLLPLLGPVAVPLSNLASSLTGSGIFMSRALSAALDGPLHFSWRAAWTDFAAAAGSCSACVLLSLWWGPATSWRELAVLAVITSALAGLIVAGFSSQIRGAACAALRRSRDLG